jgi:uncharacterized phage protein gp47/JayE
MSILDLVSKSLDDIRTEVFGYLSAKQAEYSAKGWLPIKLNLNKGIVRGMIEVWCWGLWQLYQFLALILKQAFPDTATGLWLRLHCKQVNVFALDATKTTGTVYFLREDTAGNMPIAAGKVIRTKPDGLGQVWRYITQEAVVIPAGAAEIAVIVEAEEYGAGSNATAGQICEIVTVIPGIDGVENREGWLIAEGSDAELDDALRERYVLAWQALSGCTKYAYQAWARSVTGVVAAKILDQHPRGQGTVDVVVQGTAGVPTQGLIDAVHAKIFGTGNDDELYPINDDVLVKGPTPVEVTIEAELEITFGDPAAIVAEAENRARALFVSSPILGMDPLGGGQDATLDRLRVPLKLPGVKRINFTQPALDVVVPEDGLAVLAGITLTYTVVED